MEGTDSGEETDCDEFVYDSETSTYDDAPDDEPEQSASTPHLCQTSTRLRREHELIRLLNSESDLTNAKLQEIVESLAIADIVPMLFRNIPILKVEVLNERMWYTLVSATLFLYVFSLANSILYGSLIKAAFSDECNTAIFSRPFVATLLYTQLILSTFVYLVLLFLLFAFPQRILVRLFRDKIYPAPEQTAIVLVVILVNLTPGFNIIRLLYIWQYVCFDFVTLVTTLGLITCNNTDVIPNASDVGGESCQFSIGFELEESAFNFANNFFNVSFLTCISFAVSTIINFQAIPCDLPSFVSSKDLEAEAKIDMRTVEDQMEEDYKKRQDARIQVRLQKKIQDEVINPGLKSISCCNQLAITWRMMKPGISGWLLLACCIYIIFQLVVSSMLEFNVSIVPFAGLVSVFRVCLAVNENGNFIGYCTQGSTAFRRAMVVAVGFALEVVIFIVLPRRFIHKTRRKLKSLPYAENRSKHLGFHFFITLTVMTSIVALALSLTSIFLEPAEYWVVRIFLNETTNELDGEINPLYFVGMSPFEPEFLSVYLIFVSWLGALCLAYLPADSIGFRGWFVSASEIKVKKWRQKAYFKSQPLLYIVSEDDFMSLLMLSKTNSHSTTSLTIPKTRYPGMTNVTANDLSRMVNNLIIPTHLHESDMSGQDLGLISYQIKSHVLCMETAMILFSFTNASYYMDKDKTNEENAKVVEDQRFILELFSVAPETDTVVLIASSADRIVVSFRGTVTGKNVKTDLDFELTKHEGADAIKDSFPDLVAPDVPMVHSGFHKAYAAVKTEVIQVVSRLLETKQRSVFCCGHSLGGGLATMATFDIATQLNPVGVSCTTFGCPKVGNYWFREIYNRAVPSHFRFVLVRDVIPALRKPFGFFVYQHVGVEIVLDLQGTLIINPNFIERLLLLRFRRYNQSNHFMSRYGFALMMWIARAHGDKWTPPTWLAVNNSITKHCHERIEHLSKQDYKLVGQLRKILIGEGVEFKKHNTMFRDIGVQTGDIDEDTPDIKTLYIT